MANIAILGSGGWGMAMAVNQLQNGHALTLWSPYAEEIESLRNMRGNARLLPGIVLPEQIGLTTDLSCAAKADICAVSYTHLRRRRSDPDRRARRCDGAGHQNCRLCRRQGQSQRHRGQ